MTLTAKAAGRLSQKSVIHASVCFVTGCATGAAFGRERRGCFMLIEKRSTTLRMTLVTGQGSAMTESGSGRAGKFVAIQALYAPTGDRVVGIPRILMLHGDMTLATKLFLSLGSYILVNAMAGRAGKPFAKHRIKPNAFLFLMRMMTFRTKLSCFVRVIAGRVKDVIPGRIISVNLASLVTINTRDVDIRHSCQIPGLTRRLGQRYIELVMAGKAGFIIHFGFAYLRRKAECPCGYYNGRNDNQATPA